MSNMAKEKIADRIALRLDPDLQRRLNEFRDRQTVKPAASDIVRLALEQFLDRNSVDKPEVKRR